MEQTSYNGIPVIYYKLDEFTNFEELQAIYDRLSKKLPNLIIIPENYRIKTTSLNDLKAIRDNLNLFIADLEKKLNEQK